MKPNRWLTQVALACLVISPLAHAALGGNAQSVQADQAGMGASRAAANQALNAVQGNYSVQAMTLPSGTVVHEYLSNTGIVFAVSWLGSVMPDLHQILGTYTGAASDAVQAYRAQHPGIGPVSVAANNMVIQSSGHMGVYAGRAYLPSALPAGVALTEIQ
jgi:hypothetical protein